MTKHFDATAVPVGTQVLIPLDRLKKSPKNVRKVPHTEAAIEAYAASIAAKGILQNLVVAPEFDDGGAETGCYFVTIGEGRRLGQRLRVKRKEIKKTEPIPCVIRLQDDAMEVSLDENVTRENMHPADQFEAFRALNEERGMGVEDIAARFGVSAQIVKQRLRLGAVSPRLMQAYRDEDLTLDQLMAFCITEDHARQEAVFHRLTDYQREAYHIRRLLTETNVKAGDRRARFVGAETYTNAGGHIARDLFTEDDGGYFEDAGLLDAIVLQRLTAMAVGVQGAEGWKWAEAYIDYPYSNGMRRAYPKSRDLSDDDKEALQTAHDALFQLSTEYETFESLPEEVDAQMTMLENEVARLEALTSGYDDDDILRGGIIVSLTHDGTAKIERGLIRLEDLAPAPEPETPPAAEGGDGGDFRDDQEREVSAPEEDEESGKPLSDALIRDLTAHRTVGLRLALGEQPEMAARALAYTLVMRVFNGRKDASCLEILPVSTDISGFADDYQASPAAEALQVRHDAWAARLPTDANALWADLMSMEAETLGLLIAHCVALTLNVVRQPYDRRIAVFEMSDRLAAQLPLDMTGHWRPTVRSYFGRVTKGHIMDAVREAVSDEAAERLTSLKKLPMAEAAEQLVIGTGWLPAILRTAKAVQPKPEPVSEPDLALAPITEPDGDAGQETGGEPPLQEAAE